jgi:hypothetical protein
MPIPSLKRTEMPIAIIAYGLEPEPIPPKMTVRVFTQPSKPPYIADFRYSPDYIWRS